MMVNFATPYSAGTLRTFDLGYMRSTLLAVPAEVAATDIMPNRRAHHISSHHQGLSRFAWIIGTFSLCSLQSAWQLLKK